MSNERTESISAKLRRLADESYECGKYPSTLAGQEFGYPDPNNRVAERELFRRIADEIDAEKQAVLRNCAYPLSESVGKPLKGDEDFKSWLDRYYLPRPLFEDGEPVWFGDRYVNDYGRPATLSSLNYTKGDHNYVSMDAGQRHKVTSRVKRDLPQTLDADGVPIEEYDVVYPNYGTYANRKSTVLDVRGQDDVIVSINGGGFERFNGKYLTHREPDSQERINGDALKGDYEYWGCNGVECTRCPALVDGKKPKERHGVLWCSEAKALDLLRRQRELDGRDA